MLSPLALVACAAALSYPAVASAQRATARSTPVGTFVGHDSLDAQKEAGTASRVRPDVHGSATWTIELDSLDLRRKFTLRFDIPEPSPVTIVLRSLDSLPPRTGQYTVMLASTGASHSRGGSLHGEVYAREGNRDRRYVVWRARVVVTSVTMAAGQPLVTGNVEFKGNRYADPTPGKLVRESVWLTIDGQFSAHAASDARPRLFVTSQMQEAVLRRALDGFAITWVGAGNADGSADSARQSATARAFLESRWRDAAIIERVEATPERYAIRLRGRLVPVVCEGESTSAETHCVSVSGTRGQASAQR